MHNQYKAVEDAQADPKADVKTAEDIANEIITGNTRTVYVAEGGRLGLNDHYEERTSKTGVAGSLWVLQQRDQESFAEVKAILDKQFSGLDAAIAKWDRRFVEAVKNLARGQSLSASAEVSVLTQQAYDVFYNTAQQAGSRGSRVFSGLILDTAYGGDNQRAQPQAAVDMLTLAIVDPVLSPTAAAQIIGDVYWADTRARFGGLGRFIGGVGMVAGGASMTAGGVASSEIGIGVPIAVAGIATTGLGIDNTWTGLKQIWTGKPQSLTSSNLLVKAGMSRRHANFLAEGASIVAAFGSAGYNALSRASAYKSIPKSQLHKLEDGIEGIYEFWEGGKLYVVQSSNIARRLAQHGARINDGTKIRYRSITGGKEVREVAEHLRLLKVTKGQGVLPNSKFVTNKVNPIGPARQHLISKYQHLVK